MPSKAPYNSMATPTSAGAGVAGKLASTGMGVAAAQGITSGLVSGGVAAAVPLAMRGIMALTPAAREQRKLDKKMREEALEAWERGKKRGFGPSAKKRSKMVDDRMRQYSQQMKGMETALDRREAALGFGRSAQMAQSREGLAQQRADVLGRTRAGVEADSRALAAQRRQATLNQLQGERAMEAQRLAERRQFATDVGTGAITTGIAVGKGKADQIKQDTYRDKELRMIGAASGLSAEDFASLGI